MKNARICPVCRQAMKTHTSHGIEVDLCGRCGGLWLDAGEFDGLLGQQFKLQDFEDAFDASATLPVTCRYCRLSYAGGQIKCEACQRSLGLGCPVDGRGMHIVHFGEIEFDRCPSCRGIWVDGFEREAMGVYARTVQRESQQRTVDFYIAPPAADDWSTESDWGSNRNRGRSEAGQRTTTESAHRPGAGPADVECAGCKMLVNRYRTWAVDDTFWCMRCAERSDVKERLQGELALQRHVHELNMQRPYNGGESARIWREVMTTRMRVNGLYDLEFLELFVRAIGTLFRKE